MRRLVALLALCLLTAACSPHPQKRADTMPTEQPAAGLPKTLTELLASGKARKARIYLDASGRVVKASLYVQAADLPDWVLPLAETTIGAGSEDSYEVEYYEGIGMAYEVTRQVEGVRREVSFGEDKRVLYTEVLVERDALPQPAKDAITQAEASGATFKRSVKKSVTGGDEQLQVRLISGENEHRLVFTLAGELLSRSLDTPARVEITTSK
jgi:hypothetical protein